MIQLKENSLLPRATKLGDRFQVVKSFYGELLYLDGMVTSIPPHRRFGVVTYGDGIRESWPIVPQKIRQHRKPVDRKRAQRRAEKMDRLGRSWQCRLKTLRQAAGMSQKEVCRHLPGVAPSTYGAWERCERVAPRELLETVFPELSPDNEKTPPTEG